MVNTEDTNQSDKIKAEDLSKRTFYNNNNLHVFYIKGGNKKSSIRGLRVDGKSRKIMIAVGNTLTKGLWWKGKETNNSPKFFWFTSSKGNAHIFVGRLSFVLQTRKLDEVEGQLS